MTPSNTIEELVGLQEHEARFRVRQIIANMASGSAEIEPYETLAGLGLDSLDLVELDVRIATEFELSFAKGLPAECFVACWTARSNGPPTMIGGRTTSEPASSASPRATFPPR